MHRIAIEVFLGVFFLLTCCVPVSCTMDTWEVFYEAALVTLCNSLFLMSGPFVVRSVNHSFLNCAANLKCRITNGFQIMAERYWDVEFVTVLENCM